MRASKPFSESTRQVVIDAAEVVMGLLPPTWKRRSLARLFDFGLFWLMALAYPYGTVLGFAFVLFADGLWRGQSPGKWIFGLQVRRLADGRAARLWQSAARNLPFFLLCLFALIPLLGLFLLATVGLLVVGMEFLATRRDALRRRAGDILAGTQVVPVRAFRLAIREAVEKARSQPGQESEP